MADLVTRSRLDDSDFNRGLARMRKEARDFNRRLGSEFSKVFSGAAVGGGIAAALYGIGNAVRGAFAEADKVSDLAETLREMPSDLVRVGGAAALLGSDMEGVIKAAVKLRVNLGKASEGGKEQAETLDAMGLKASELSRMRLPDMIVALAQGYQRAEASGRGFLALQTLLSRGGTELANLLQRSPEELRELFESIKPASDAALMGMGVVADQWNLMLGNMKGRFQDWIWGTYAGWRKFRASLEASEEVGGKTRERFAAEKGAVLGDISDRRKRIRAEAALYKKIYGEEMAKWMSSNAEDVGFMTEGAGYRPEGQIDRAKGGIADGAEGGSAAESEKKKIAGLIAEWWKLKKAREEAGRTLEGQLTYLTESYAAHRNMMGAMDRDSVAYREALVEEQRMLKDIEDVQRKIGEEERRKAEEAQRAKEGEAKDAEAKAGEAAKLRELALEASIAKLKGDGKDHAAEETRLRVAAAEREYEFAKGTKREAEAYVALMVARNNLTEAQSGEGGKTRNERIEEYIGGGMAAGQAKKKVRAEDRDVRKAEARIRAYRRGAEDAPDIMGEGVCGYMDSHRNASGAGAFDSGAWESGSHGDAVRKDVENFKGGEAAADSGQGQTTILRAIQKSLEAMASNIASATGGS